MNENSGAPSISAFAATLGTPFGPFGIRIEGERIAELAFLPPGTSLRAPDCPLARRTALQIENWLNDPDFCFDLPLAARGTPFQQRVWARISCIPRGQVRTYGDLAARLGSASRAVGQACGANPFPLVIPCHRVVSKSGIGGFAGACSGHLLDTKRWLLDFESRR